jgi:hypothetical protein
MEKTITWLSGVKGLQNIISKIRGSTELSVVCHKRARKSSRTVFRSAYTAEMYKKQPVLLKVPFFPK